MNRSPDIPRPTHTPAPEDQTRSYGVRFRAQHNHARRTSPDRPAPTRPGQEGQAGRTVRNYLRVQQFQKRWENIKEDLPPQFTRSHIGMISIGGVIGTGLFLGSASALTHGGPIGSVLGYAIVGTMVYCLCVSIGEMIAFLPNVGGVVGLADLFVDRALGFSLGWAAWYNWSVTLPTEVAAATVLAGMWNHGTVPSLAMSAIFLFAATAINCFPSRVYGEFEFWLSSMKVITIVFIVIVSLIIDMGAGKNGFIGFSKWKKPFAEDYLGVTGNLGRFLGFWSVLLQACFSFFGSEVPGIAAGEVIDATRNVPRALQRVWIRITLFYVGGIFCAGLLVDSNDPALTQDGGTANSSPFVIAFKEAGIGYLSHLINAAILLSAWSAAASDIYISSRFLFFLARCNHAPQFLATLFRYPSKPKVVVTSPEDSTEEDIEDLDDADLQPVFQITTHGDSSRTQPAGSVCIPGVNTRADDHYDCDVSSEEFHVSVISVNDEADNQSAADPQPDVESGARPKSRDFVLPLPAVLVSASVGFLAFLSVVGGSASNTFNWLSAVASIASLQSWTGMLYTYIRWHKGTIYHEKQAREKLRKYAPTHEDYDRARQTADNIERIKKNRHRGQPYLAYYAFGMCVTILFTNGWSVFLHSGWRIANLTDSEAQSYAYQVGIFLASYIPIPFFVLLTLGYKIIKQTKKVEVEDMVFYGKHFQREEPDITPPSKREKILGFLLVL